MSETTLRVLARGAILLIMLTFWLILFLYGSKYQDLLATTKDVRKGVLYRLVFPLFLLGVICGQGWLSTISKPSGNAHDSFLSVVLFIETAVGLVLAFRSVMAARRE